MEATASHIDHEAIVSAIFKGMSNSPEMIQQMAMQYGKLLTFKDVLQLTGWGEKKLMAKIKDRTIPMVKDGEWFITYPAYMRAIDKYYESKMPKRRYKR